MASFTVRIGVILMLLGVSSYVITGARSVTALIPAIVGAALALCGVLASRSRDPRPVALRVAVAVAGLGFLATAAALGQVGSLLAGPARPALIARASMAAILLVYLVFATRAFVRDASSRTRS